MNNVIDRTHVSCFFCVPFIRALLSCLKMFPWFVFFENDSRQLHLSYDWLSADHMIVVLISCHDSNRNCTLQFSYRFLNLSDRISHKQFPATFQTSLVVLPERCLYVYFCVCSSHALIRVQQCSQLNMVVVELFADVARHNQSNQIKPHQHCPHQTKYNKHYMLFWTRTCCLLVMKIWCYREIQSLMYEICFSK